MLNTSLASNSTPKMFFHRLTDITPAVLKGAGVKAVAVDLDNTLVYDFSSHFIDGVQHWVNTLLNAGLPVLILSNGGDKRVQRIASKLGVDYIAHAKKPETTGFTAAAERLHVNIRELAMIGDQLFTDIQGANAAGAVSVRVHWAKREKRGVLRFYLLRKKEEKYLKNAGYGDYI